MWIYTFEGTAANRRVPLHLVDATDGITPETGEAAGQPQISKNGGAFANTTATLTAIGNGAYYVELTATEVNTVGFAIVRYKSAATAEAQVMVFISNVDPTDSVRFGMSALPDAAADAAGGLPISDAGSLDLDQNATNISAILTDTGTSGVLLAGTATSAQLVDDVWDEPLTGGTHNVVNSSGRRLRFLQEAGIYAGAIWIDTVNGTAGTTDFENGTDSLPVSNIADANTLAASLGISRFMVAPGSTITFAAAQQNQSFSGASWTLALGGQNIDGSSFEGAAVSGVGTSTAGTQYFFCCNMGTVTLPDDTHVITCGMGDTTTLGVAGDYFFDRCHSRVAGTGTPVIDFGSLLNASNVSVRAYSGGIEIQNMGAGTGSYNMSLEGNGQLVINANCSATSTVAIRGNFTVTDNAGGAVTLSDDARYDTSQPVGSVTAGVTLATDAVDAAALATDAVNEIRDAIMPTQNATFNNIQFLFVATSDGKTPVTGATGMSVARVIDGGAEAAGTGTGPTEIGNGLYQYDASAADMNGGVITFRFSATGGTPGAPDDRFVTIVTGGGV